jgi:hypothetical protein
MVNVGSAARIGDDLACLIAMGLCKSRLNIHPESILKELLQSVFSNSEVAPRP